MEAPWNDCVIYIDMLYMCIQFYMLYLLSSPYLLVFGDDRVRSTREQMILMQVWLVMFIHGVGIAWGFFYIFSCFMFLA